MGGLDRLRGAGMTARLRRVYGASPLHLLAHLALLPLTAFALLQIAGAGNAQRIFVWLAASAIVHDLLLLPCYGVLDRLARRAAGPAVNYVRIPALISALLLLVYLPAIAGMGAGTFRRVSGLDREGYLERWLLATAALFIVSGALYLLRRSSSPGPRGRPRR
jgi:hypothetical protein